jgi:hypothetical protein
MGYYGEAEHHAQTQQKTTFGGIRHHHMLHFSLKLKYQSTEPRLIQMFINWDKVLNPKRT